MRTTQIKIEGFNVWLRKGSNGELSSDERAIREVITNKAYSRVRSGFDVLPGEKWLDLGGNIGAFTVYCRLRGATTVSFEPEPECFKLLQRNLGIGSTAFQQAVTASREPLLTLYHSPNPEDNYRNTEFEVRGYEKLPPVSNFYAGKLKELPQRFDGIKMDIEGSEGAILDNWLLPRCSKLVMEYHTSRDASTTNLARRLTILKNKFKFVKYPKLFDLAITARAETCRPRFDQLIFAWEPKK